MRFMDKNEYVSLLTDDEIDEDSYLNLGNTDSYGFDSNFINDINIQILINNLAQRIEDNELRQMFILRCDETPLEEICNMFKLTLNQVKQRLRKVRQHFVKEDFMVCSN